MTNDKEVVLNAIEMALAMSDGMTLRKQAQSITGEFHRIGLEVTPGWSSDMKAAPRDGTPILFAGYWNENAATGEGSPEIALVRWSSVMSDGVSGYQWFAGYLTPLDSVAVTWTHWKPLGPLPPGEEPNQESNDVNSA